jgi:hypothetical protein
MGTASRFPWQLELQDELECELNRTAAHRFAVALEELSATFNNDVIAPHCRHGEPHRAYWLAGHTTAWSCDSAHGNRHVCARYTQRAACHLSHRLLAYSAIRVERLLRHAEIADLCSVRVGHVATLEPVRAVGDVRHRLRYPSGCA